MKLCSLVPARGLQDAAYWWTDCISSMEEVIFMRHFEWNFFCLKLFSVCLVLTAVVSSLYAFKPLMQPAV